jgi:hypothetical protein
MSDRTMRMGGVAALVFVALILVGVLSGGSPPAADDSAEKIRAYFVDHRGALILGNLCGLIGSAFVVWFAVVLREALRGDRLTSALGTASLAGILVTAPLALAGSAVFTAPVWVDGAAEHLGDDAVRLAYLTQNLLFAGTSCGLALCGATTALAIRRSGALPAYTMWLAALVAVGNIVVAVSTVSSDALVLGFIGISTFALFLLVTGIAMLTGKASPAATTA